MFLIIVSVQITHSISDILTPTAIALGNFDGLHQGHQQVLKPILDTQKASHSSIHATVVTFNPHPQEFFSGKSRQLLTPLEEKADRLATLGIKQLIFLPFNQQLARLTPEEFFNQIIIRDIQAKQISVGEDFCFGYQRQGDIQKLRELANLSGIDLHITPLEKGNTPKRISSSLIRQALAQGKIEQANQMLGYSYTIWGKVVKGQQLGRKLGFPTANLQIPSNKLLPHYGVYGGWMSIESQSDPIVAAINIGERPTVQGTHPTVEVHLLNWQGNLYDKKVKVSLEHFIRPEKRFSSLEQLKNQIYQDCESIRQILN